MRAIYNLNIPEERKMYLEIKTNNYKRQIDDTKTIQEKYNDIIKERQIQFDFINNYLEQIENDFIKEVEQKTETAVNEILKSLNF